MNVTLVQHAQHNVDSNEGRQDQDRLARQRILKCSGSSLKAGLNALGQTDLLLYLVDCGDPVAEGGARREVERHGDYRKLPLMVHCEGRVHRLQVSKSAERHGSAHARLNVEMVQVRRILLKSGQRFHHNMVLIQLCKYRRDLALAEGVIKGVVEGLRRDAEAGSRRAVDDKAGVKALVLLVAGHVA